MLIKTEGWRGLCFDASSDGHFLAFAGKRIAEGAPRSLACRRQGLGFGAYRWAGIVRVLLSTGDLDIGIGILQQRDGRDSDDWAFRFDRILQSFITMFLDFDCRDRRQTSTVVRIQMGGI